MIKSSENLVQGSTIRLIGTNLRVEAVNLSDSSLVFYILPGLLMNENTPSFVTDSGENYSYFGSVDIRIHVLWLKKKLNQS